MLMKSILARQAAFAQRCRVVQETLTQVHELSAPYEGRTAGICIPEPWRPQLNRVREQHGLGSQRSTLLFLILLGLNVSEELRETSPDVSEEIRE